MIFLKGQNSQRGSIAIMMVITAVLIITPIMINFTFDAGVNKIKVNNIEDRAKAKLTAESGLRFAMARLRMYKEAYNFLENNSAAKEIVKQDTLDIIWNFPFIYPIPKNKKMNAIQKEAISDFHEKTVLNGNMQLMINNISNKINLNLLRISLLVDAQKSQNSEEGTDNESTEEDQSFSAETQLLNILNNAIEKESEKDEVFSAEHYGKETDLLINELKYFISDPNSIADAAGGDTNFVTENIEPKKAPLVSYTEMYTLPGWADAITNLISNEFTVHGAVMVDLNKITDKLLKILIPDISDEDITEFFKYKNDEDDPKHFNSLDDFKNYIVNIGNIMNEDAFQDRFDKFKKQGLQFGPTPTLFKISCTSTVGRSTYKLTAYVTIPAQPLPRPVKKDGEEEEDKQNSDNSENPDSEVKDTTKDTTKDEGETEEDDKEKEEQKTLLLEPRIVEIIIS